MKQARKHTHRTGNLKNQSHGGDATKICSCWTAGGGGEPGKSSERTVFSLRVSHTTPVPPSPDAFSYKKNTAVLTQAFISHLLTQVLLFIVSRISVLAQCADVYNSS